MRYVIRRISPLSALIYGLLLGMFGWIIPGLLLGWGARSAVLGLRNWLGGLQLTIPLPLGDPIVIDLSTVGPLAAVQTRLSALSAQETTLVLAVTLGTIAAGMLLTGLSALLGAIVYNVIAKLFGGAEVTLDALDIAARPVAMRLAPTANPRPAAPAATVAPAPIVAPRPRPEPDGTGQAAPAAWLASEAGERWPLNATVTRLGSASDNDIVVTGLAPQHAEIRRESDRYLIYDLGSRRTWVNDTQVAAVHMLKDGFRLKLGQADFQVRIPAPNLASKEQR
jgi:hypothetical protein